MNNFFQFQSSDRVLLLGEGNFSFTSNLLQILLDRDSGSGIASIVATCFEPLSEDFSEEKKRNIDYLKRKGATVLFGVDVNHLEQHFIKGTDVFSKVIFNFPHVGGKMKIHLNRSLLSQIFKNVSDYISDESKICITLCDGQGGTGADSKLRRHDDSWQVVEMAAMSNFTLKFIEPFPVALFPNYCSVGYRGYDKGFHIENSLSHIFQLATPLKTFYSDNDVFDLFSMGQIHTDYGVITCARVHSYCHSLNLFSKSDSAFNFIFQKLQFVLEKLPERGKSLMPENILPIHKSFTDGMPSFLNGTKIKLCSSLAEMLESAPTIPCDFNNSLIVFKSCCFKELSHCFETSPVEGEIMLLGCESFKYLINFFELLREQFQFRFEIANYDQNLKEVYLIPKPSSKVLVARFGFVLLSDKQSFPSSTIYCDPLVKSLFKVKHWQEIWSENTSLVPETSSISLACLYPSIYLFDVNFLVKPDFKVRDFLELMWNLTPIAVLNSELISEYVPPEDNSKKYLCFRVHYKSFRHPLCRNAALDFHKNVVSKAIQLVLKAPIC